MTRTEIRRSSGTRRSQRGNATMACLLAGVLLGGASYWYGARPQFERNADSEASNQKLRQSIAEQQARVDQIEQLRADNVRLEKEMDDFMRQVPRSENTARLLDSIYADASASGVKLSQVSRKVKASSIAGIDELRIDLNATGKYGAIEGFVRRLQNGERMISVDTLNMRLKDQEIESTLSLRSFLMREVNPASAAATSEPAVGQAGAGGTP